MTMNRTLHFALAAAMLTVTGPAWSAGAQDETAAAALFQEAKLLAGAGDFERACPKFVEAQRLFPTTGTLLNVGNCYEKVAKLASAWGAFKAAEVSARVAGDSGREGEAARRAALLALQLAHLTVVVPPAARVKGFEVHRDGSAVGEGQWGSSLPSDVGFHTIEASAPGHKTWSTTIRIDTNGSAATVEIPRLEKLSEPTPAGLPASSSPQKPIGYAAVGVGGVGLVIGAILGAVALSKDAASKANCSPMNPNFCNDTGASVRSDAVGLGNGSSAALGIGGAMVVAAIVIFATTPSTKTPDRARIEVLPGVGHLAFRGTF